MLYYAAMSTIGSVIGSLLVDVIFRKAGEKGSEKHLSQTPPGLRQRTQGEERRLGIGVRIHRSPALPLHAVHHGGSRPAVSAASECSLIVGAARMFRFTVLGVLALLFGKRILKWAENDVVQWVLIGLVVVCTIGSVISVCGWIKRSRSAAGDGASSPTQVTAADRTSPASASIKRRRIVQPGHHPVISNAQARAPARDARYRSRAASPRDPRRTRSAPPALLAALCRQVLDGLVHRRRSHFDAPTLLW